MKMNFNDLEKEKKQIANANNISDKDTIKIQMRIIEELEKHNEQLIRQNKDFLARTDRQIQNLTAVVEKYVQTNAATQIRIKEYTEYSSWLFRFVLAIAMIASISLVYNSFKLTKINNNLYEFYQVTNDVFWKIGNELNLPSFQPTKPSK